MDQSVKSISFNLTGFGEFQGVLDNPTKTLIESLTPEEITQYNIQQSNVLEVSIQGVDEHISNCDPTCNVSVHLGVNSSAERFVLEQTAYNNKTFSVPDMRNNQCNSEKINCDEELDWPLCSALNLNEIHSCLEKEHPTAFQLGSNPGRYICNYIYFKSLQSFQSTSESTPSNNRYSLFLHCPTFLVIPFQQQKQCVLFLLKAIQQSLSQ